MMTLLILIVLAWAFYIGFTRGIFLQGFYTIGSLIALAIAQAYYQNLAKLLYIWVPYANPSEGTQVAFFKTVDLFSHDLIFYAGVAFMSLYLIAYAAIRLLGILIHLAPLERFDSRPNNIIAGLLSCLVTCFTLSMGFTILATISYGSVQSILAGNALIRFFIESFPFFSHYLHHLWITQVIH